MCTQSSKINCSAGQIFSMGRNIALCLHCGICFVFSTQHVWISCYQYHRPLVARLALGIIRQVRSCSKCRQPSLKQVTLVSENRLQDESPKSNDSYCTDLYGLYNHHLPYHICWGVTPFLWHTHVQLVARSWKMGMGTSYIQKLRCSWESWRTSSDNLWFFDSTLR